MMLVCPQCKGTFEHQLLCPKCGVRLELEGKRSRADSGFITRATTTWQQTPWGRLAVGLCLAVGLYYVLRQLVTATLVMAGIGTDWWNTTNGLILQGGLQGIGVLAGGTLAGAGKRWGAAYGAIVGFCCGVLLIAFGIATREWNLVELYGLPLVQAGFGLLGGYIGAAVWKPLPVLTAMPGPADPTPRPTKIKKRHRSKVLDGPIAWGRVMVGALVAVAGTLWADVILEFVLRGFEREFSPDREQALLITKELMVLAMLVGSGIAGATTPNGPKQGWVVGLGVGIVLVPFYLLRRTAPEQTLGFLLAGLAPLAPPMVYIVPTLISALVLGLAGGWFGGQLLPPVIRSRQRGLGPLS